MVERLVKMLPVPSSIKVELRRGYELFALFSSVAPVNQDYPVLFGVDHDVLWEPRPVHDSNVMRSVHSDPEPTCNPCNVLWVNPVRVRVDDVSQRDESVKIVHDNATACLACRCVPVRERVNGLRMKHLVCVWDVFECLQCSDLSFNEVAVR